MKGQLKNVFLRAIEKISIAFVLAGCLTPIEIETNPAAGFGKVVISGQISTITDRNYVEIGTTSSEGHLPDAISGALVSLHDNFGGITYFQENFEKAGRYELPYLAGIPGRVYTIQVELPNHQVYTSKTEVMPTAVGLDEVYYTFVDEEFIDFEGSLQTSTFLKAYVKPTFPNSKPYLCRWAVEEVYQIKPTDLPDPFGYTPPDCFVTQNADPQRITLFDGREFSGDLTSDLLVTSREIDQTFHHRHYFSIYHSALTSEAFDYWTKVNVLANQTGSIFDTPPAEIIGNISNVNDPDEKVYGFFQATNQTMQRFYVLSAYLPEQAWLEPYCEYTSVKPELYQYPPPCQDCLNVRNSSYTRPDWF
jgi:hypothetical protein